MSLTNEQGQFETLEIYGTNQQMIEHARFCHTTFEVAGEAVNDSFQVPHSLSENIIGRSTIESANYSIDVKNQ